MSQLVSLKIEGGACMHARTHTDILKGISGKKSFTLLVYRKSIESYRDSHSAHIGYTKREYCKQKLSPL
jgi:hypothetical protein